MSECHVIRLRGPWDVAPLVAVDASDSESLPMSTRVAHPAMWPSTLADFRGAVRMTRRFGRPASLSDFDIKFSGDAVGEGIRLPQDLLPGSPLLQDPAQAPPLSVWLVLRGAAAGVRVALNGELLGTIDGATSLAQFDVTKRLAERNELTIDASPTSDPWPPDEVRQLTGDVQLEIRGDGA
jgi:hypothetical protein